MLDSPYKRPEVLADHHPCPNCNAILPAAELRGISLGCIIKAVKHREQQQRLSLLGCHGAQSDADAFLSSIEELYSEASVAWVSLPPVLRRMRRPLSELYTRRALWEQEARLCGECFDEFAGADDVLRLGSGGEAAQKCTKNSGVRRPQKPVAADAVCASRKPDRCRDMVFNSRQAVQRQNDQRLRSKRTARRRFMAQHMDDIQWAALPLRTAITKELRELSDRQRGEGNACHAHRPPAIAGEDARGASHTEATLGWTPTGCFEESRGDAAGATVSRALVPASSAPCAAPTESDPLPPGEPRTLACAAGTIDEVEELLPAPSRVTPFDVSFAQHCMHDLLDTLTRVCAFPCASAIEDVPKEHPLFTVYRRSANRFPAPPGHPVDLQLVDSLAVDALLEEQTHGIATKRRFDVVVRECAPQFDYFQDPDERSLLAAIIADPTISGEALDGVTHVLESQSGSSYSDVEEDFGDDQAGADGVVSEPDW